MAGERRLIECPECHGDFVDPGDDFVELPGRRWLMHLTCRACDWAEKIVVDKATVDRFDRDLDKAENAINRDLRRIETDVFADEVERFVEALQLDAVLPEDFVV